MIKPITLAALALAVAAGGAYAAKGGKKGTDSTTTPAISKKENLNRNSGEDKNKGLERAQERMSEQGLDHSQASAAQQIHKKDKKDKKPKKK